MAIVGESGSGKSTLLQLLSAHLPADEGRVRPHVAAVFQLEDVRDAQAELEGRHIQGKVVLQMG